MGHGIAAAADAPVSVRRTLEVAAASADAYINGEVAPGGDHPGLRVRIDADEGLLSGCLVLAVSGELDVYTASLLRTSLRAAFERLSVYRIVLDLSGLAFIDSGGMGLLIGAQRRALGAGGGIALARAGYSIRHVLEVTRLKRVLPAFPSIREAQAHLLALCPDKDTDDLFARLL